jgi:hypothetical protein
MPRRLLIVATAPDPSDELLERLGRDARGDVEVAVIAPASDVSLIEWLTGDETRAREEAQRRAIEAAEVESLAANVIDVTVGDPDPIAAVEDALRRFPADELVLVTRPKEAAMWLEKRAILGELERFGLPVTYLVDDDMGESATANVVPFPRPASRVAVVEPSEVQSAVRPCAETVEARLAAVEPRPVATILFDAAGCPTDEPSVAVKGDVVEVGRGGRLLRVVDALEWRVDPQSLEGGLGTLATRPRRGGTSRKRASPASLFRGAAEYLRRRKRSTRWL